MIPLLSIAVFIILVAAIAEIVIKQGRQGGQYSYSYRKKEYLLTKAEKDFFFVLQEIVGSDFLIFSKVRLLDILYIPRGIKSREYYHYLNRIQSKHVDFLICDKGNIKPLLAIELDDSSHFQSHRIARDQFVDEIFESAGLPILHIRNSFAHDKEGLKSQIDKALM